MLQTRNKYFFLPLVATAKKKVKRSRLLTFSKFLICVSMHADPQCLPSCLVKHFQHFRLDSHEPRAAFVLSHGNYSLLPWQNNNSLNKEHNTDELSDLTHFTAHPPSPSSFLSFHPVSFFFFFQICLVLLIHFSNHPTPAPRLSKMKHPIWGPICWMILSRLMHVHKPVFYAKALSTPSWPICSLFIHPIFCLSSISLSLFHLAMCLSSYFSWLSWFVTLMPSTQMHAIKCLYHLVLYVTPIWALESYCVLQSLLQSLDGYNSANVLHHPRNVFCSVSCDANV